MKKWLIGLIAFLLLAVPGAAEESRVYYGKEYGLTIQSSSEGTDVIMRIPKMMPEE